LKNKIWKDTMTLPPPPDSFFEGGEPQSQVSPGETGRELLHEAKNLAQAVSLLSVVVQKQRQRQRQIIFSCLVALVALMMAIGYTRFLSVQQTQQRLKSGHEACVRDNERGALEVEILQASAALNPGAKAFFEPRITKFEALTKDCDRLYPGQGQNGYPNFWDFQN
jgi:hypothetical protein